MRRSSALLGCAVALTLGGARTVLAQPPAESPRAVELTVAAAPDEAAPVTRAIEELLAGLGVATRARRVEAIDPREVVEPPPSPRSALARVWMSLHPPHAILYLADGPWERVLVRRIPLPALDEASREQLAQIVHTAVEALLAGARIGLEREVARRELMPDVQPGDEPPEPPPPPPTEPGAAVTPAPSPAPPSPSPPSPAPPSPTLAAATSIEGWLGGALPAWADGPLLGGAAFARGVFVAGAGRWRAVVALEASLRPPRTVEAAGIAIRLRSLDVRIEAGADLSLDPATSLRAAAGLTLDVTSIEPRAQSSDVTAGEARDDLMPLVSARVGVRRQLWRWLWATAGVGVEIDLVDTRYVVRDGDGPIGVLDPWSVRPWPFVALGGRL